MTVSAHHDRNVKRPTSITSPTTLSVALFGRLKRSQTVLIYGIESASAYACSPMYQWRCQCPVRAINVSALPCSSPQCSFEIPSLTSQKHNAFFVWFMRWPTRTRTSTVWRLSLLLLLICYREPRSVQSPNVVLPTSESNIITIYVII